MNKWFLIKIGKVLRFFAIGTLALGLIVMWVWNAMIPELFQGPSLTFWQAVGLLVLSHILLRGWGRWRYADGWRRDRWKRRFEEKLASMTPEEREKFKDEWGRKCGWPSESRQHPEKSEDATA